MTDTSVAVTTSYATATTFTGTYTVGAGENTSDLDGDRVSSMGINKLEDVAGNSTDSIAITVSSIAVTSNIVIDGDAPTVTINQDGAQTDPAMASPINFAVVFSESVANFVTGDVTITGTAGATSGTVTGSGTTYNVAVSGMTQDGTVTVAIEAGKATDAAGNPNAASATGDDTVTYYLHPTIEKEFSPNSLAAGETSTLTFTLTNPNTQTNLTLNGLNFTDNFPAGVEIATTPNIGGTCNSNNVLATHFTPNLAAGNTQVNLVSGSGYSLAEDTDCTITVDVTPVTVATFVNVSGNIGSTETGAGTDNATDTLTADKPTLTINTPGAFNTDNIDSTGGTPDPSAIDCPNSGGTDVCAVQFDYNDIVTLNVTVDAGSSFVGWTDDCAAFGSALSGVINMKGDKTCTATFAAQPEIDVQRPAGVVNSISDGGTDNLGNQAPGTVNLIYTIDNSAGGAQLDVTGVTAPTSTNTSNFTVTTAMPLNIAAGGTGTIDVSFDVDALGAFTVDMEIANNDSNENPYNVQITGTGAAIPEIDVLGNDTSIVNGDTTPELADHTDFGNADFNGVTIDRTFTIKNTGLADLDLTAGPPTITLGGPDAAEFSLKTDATTPMTASNETTFTITFDPVDDTLKQATVTINNNDGDEDPYEFSIQGTGTGPACEIDVQGNGICIPHGDTSPSALDQTDFGDVQVAGGQVTYTYTIENTGSLELNLTHNDHVMIGGTHAADFLLTTDAHTPVADSGGTTTFQITFDPTGAGLREATVTIDNDDNDEHPYTFNIQGNGIAAAQADGDSDGDDDGGGGGGLPLVRKFSVGESGGEYTGGPVRLAVKPDSLPNGTQMVIERVPVDSDDAGFIIGDEIFDINIIDADGNYISSFFPPVQVCIKPTPAQLREADYHYGNIHMLKKDGSNPWHQVSNPYRQDDYVCVDISGFSFFALGVGQLPATGFAPGIMHNLPVQPEEKLYQPLDNFVLEIPELGVDPPIIGVPLTEYGWDVTWLGNRAGYLEGTAFPTWAGNTAITAHVWDANNNPGPFVDLHTLQHGDQVVVNAFGSRYIYEVRQIDKVRADDLSSLPHSEYDVLTLITCQGYNERTGTYDWRIVVRAVLISVE